jgi:hypothetical protein
MKHWGEPMPSKPIDCTDALAKVREALKKIEDNRMDGAGFRVALNEFALLWESVALLVLNPPGMTREEAEDEARTAMSVRALTRAQMEDLIPSFATALQPAFAAGKPTRVAELEAEIERMKKELRDHEQQFGTGHYDV